MGLVELARLRLATPRTPQGPHVWQPGAKGVGAADPISQRADTARVIPFPPARQFFPALQHARVVARSVSLTWIVMVACCLVLAVKGLLPRLPGRQCHCVNESFWAPALSLHLVPPTGALRRRDSLPCKIWLRPVAAGWGTGSRTRCSDAWAGQWPGLGGAVAFLGNGFGVALQINVMKLSLIHI